jgi:UDP-N-acetylenolpyruvoylglucosamine reductase
MNAGAMGGAMFDVVEVVRFMDETGNIYERAREEIEVNYRSCPLFRNHIALGAILRGELADEKAIAEKMKKFGQKRWDSQPNKPSAGCIFKNPATIPAGRLIDELGLKGTRIRGAFVSEEHGNFIVNDGTAAAEDVLELIAAIQKVAKEKRGIKLETEVEIIGESGSEPSSSSSSFSLSNAIT